MLRVAEEAHRTDTGRQRHANEDAYFAEAPAFAVADGMGGAQAGEVASRIAADAFERPTTARRGPGGTTCAASSATANERIHKLAERDASRSGMGTTLTAALIGRRRGQPRPRRRQPRVRVPRRRPEAADQRPLAGRGAAPPGPAHRGPGRGAPAALDHHPGAGARARRRGRHDDLSGAPRRRLPAVQRRPHDDGPGGADRADPGALREPRLGRVAAWSARRTRAAAATTSRSSPSGSTRRRRRPRRSSRR